MSRNMIFWEAPSGNNYIVFGDVEIIDGDLSIKNIDTSPDIERYDLEHWELFVDCNLRECFEDEFGF